MSLNTKLIGLLFSLLAIGGQSANQTKIKHPEIAYNAIKKVVQDKKLDAVFNHENYNDNDDKICDPKYSIKWRLNEQERVVLASKTAFSVPTDKDACIAAWGVSAFSASLTLISAIASLEHIPSAIPYSFLISTILSPTVYYIYDTSVKCKYADPDILNEITLGIEEYLRLFQENNAEDINGLLEKERKYFLKIEKLLSPLLKENINLPICAKDTISYLIENYAIRFVPDLECDITNEPEFSPELFSDEDIDRAIDENDFFSTSIFNEQEKEKLGNIVKNKVKNYFRLYTDNIQKKELRAKEIQAYSEAAKLLNEKKEEVFNDSLFVAYKKREKTSQQFAYILAKNIYANVLKEVESKNKYLEHKDGQEKYLEDYDEHGKNEIFVNSIEAFFEKYFLVQFDEEEQKNVMLDEEERSDIKEMVETLFFDEIEDKEDEESEKYKSKMNNILRSFSTSSSMHFIEKFAQRVIKIALGKEKNYLDILDESDFFVFQNGCLKKRNDLKKVIKRKINELVTKNKDNSGEVLILIEQ